MRLKLLHHPSQQLFIFKIGPPSTTDQFTDLPIVLWTLFGCRTFNWAPTKCLGAPPCWSMISYWLIYRSVCQSSTYLLPNSIELPFPLDCHVSQRHFQSKWHTPETTVPWVVCPLWHAERWTFKHLSFVLFFRKRNYKAFIIYNINFITL